MRRSVIVVAVVGLSLAAAWGGSPKEDGKMLEGTWVPAEAELGGAKFPDAILMTMKLTMAGDKYTVKVGEVTDQGTFKLDTARKPKAIDITGGDGPNKGKTFLAIYEVSGDTLRVCYDLEGKTRPTQFKTEKNTQQFLVTYKRAKS